MPTGTHKQQPNGAISREQLLAYAEGRCSVHDQFEMELRMEKDPLLEEAAEGLTMPGATAGLDRLDKHRPGGSSNNGMLWSMSALIIMVLIVAGYWMITAHEQEDLVQVKEQHHQLNTAVSAPKDDGDVPEMSDPQADSPKSDQRSKKVAPSEAFHRGPVADALPIIREQPAERISGSPVEPETIRTTVVQRPVMPRDHIAGRQLHYLHDLKLIHPKELYPGNKLLEPVTNNVPASGSGDPVVDIGRNHMDYLPYMDEALAHFSRNDHRNTLADLGTLLAQYPDDPNALFYSGLSNFHLGRYRAAERQLQRAATHHMDVFREEAEWYRALTLEGAGELDVAQKEFSRIAGQGGFYAERAREKWLKGKQ